MSGLFIPLDGRLTSQNVLSGPLVGSEVMYIVSPGNASFGNSYQITLATLATFFSSGFSLDIVIVTVGATLLAPYVIQPSNSRVLLDKTISSTSYIVAPDSNTMDTSIGVLIKDIRGDADIHPITITFSGGQLCDGLSQIVIDNPYGFVSINPIPGGNGWYQT